MRMFSASSITKTQTIVKKLRKAFNGNSANNFDGERDRTDKNHVKALEIPEQHFLHSNAGEMTKKIDRMLIVPSAKYGKFKQCFSK